MLLKKDQKTWFGEGKLCDGMNEDTGVSDHRMDDLYPINATINSPVPWIRFFSGRLRGVYRDKLQYSKIMHNDQGNAASNKKANMYRTEAVFVGHHSTPLISNFLSQQSTCDPIHALRKISQSVRAATR